MAIFKQFNTNQVVVAPFNANKRFAYAGSSVSASNVGIEYYQSYQGTYISGSFPTGLTTVLDGILLFNSVKQLYYTNYLTQSTGDNFITESLIAGADPSQDQYVGPIEGPRFDNFLQSSVTQSRYFAQFSQSDFSSGNNEGPAIISIPSKLFGEQIPTSTFKFEYTSSENYTRSIVVDDTEGNLVAYYNDPTMSGSGDKVGDIFYSQGIAVITNEGSGSLKSFPKNMGLAGTSITPINPNANINSSSISFSSSLQIRENQYKCVVRDNEYSFTTNPSALRPIGELNTKPNQLSGSINISTTTYNDGGTPGVYEIALDDGLSPGSNGTANFTVAADGTISDITVVNKGRGYAPNTFVLSSLSSTGGTGNIGFFLTLEDVTNLGTENQNDTYYDFLTGSYFSPYVTTIGLYNENYQLLAVGKLSQPIPISLYVDTTFVVNFDTW
tara:strand:+ start:2743 stop:4068 length:1326 start_codon:yes stop_codon:yes gene_type:complete